MLQQRKVRPVRVGMFQLGDGRIPIQTMLNRPAADIAGNVAQAVEVEQAGCDILRTSIPNKEALAQIPAIKAQCSLPLVADIHFDYRLALESIAVGIDKIRINPGNIGEDDRVKAVANACANANVPIRIGVNAGSLEKHILAKYGAPTAEALVESALYHVGLLERYDFNDIVLSVKCSNVAMMVEAYRLLAQRCDYPLHLGVTEAGTARMGLVKSSVGIGSLLLDGIGETIRVSLTADPVEEVLAGRDILRSIGKYSEGVEVISCPTCGRTQVNLIPIAEELERRLSGVKKPLKVAVMGCAVNGPGEAREADIGVACGKGEALLFRKGKVVRKISEKEIIPVLLQEVEETVCKK